jgi:preprotein translocase subunit YajC
VGLEFLMIGALALLVYFMVRNSRKQRLSHLELEEKLQPGAEVMTSFGLFATLVSIDDDTNIAIIDAGSGTLLRVHRQTLTKVVDDAHDEAETPADDAEASTTDNKDS